MKFEWDPEKAAVNLRKHGVSFEIARRVFYDPFAFIHQDRVENGELRWQCMGFVDERVLIIVAYTYSEAEEEVIRIISARRADRRERRRYEQESREV